MRKILRLALIQCLILGFLLISAFSLLVKELPASTADQDAGATLTPGPDLNVARKDHKSISLPNGMVIIFGGSTNLAGPALKTAELWNPWTNTFNLLTMQHPFCFGAFARLLDGRYLLAGDILLDGIYGGPAAQTYNSNGNLFTPIANPPSGLAGSGAATLSSGKVLIAAGNNGGDFSQIFDPAKGTFTATGKRQLTDREWAVVLPCNDGGAVVAGGSYGSYYELLEYYNVQSNSFSTLQSNLIPGESGWFIMGSSYSNSLEEQRLPDGRYLLMAKTRDRNKKILFTFDPTTKEFAKFKTTPAIPDGKPLMPPIVDRARGKAYLINSWGIQLCEVDLKTGSLRIPRGYINYPYDIDRGSACNLLPDGRILVTGGGDPNNGVAKTFILSPISKQTSPLINLLLLLRDK